MYMIKLIDIIESFYAEPTMSKLTSIKSGVAKSLEWLYKKNVFKGNIIDYGCGQVARNSVFLREKGLKVYSYDPYWGVSGKDGWSEISSDLPNENFEVGFTSFVLNVVNINEENEILQWCNKHCKKEYHITRNLDVKDMITKALQRKDKLVTDFYINVFSGDINKPITDKDIEEFSFFGTKTSKGFQRIPELSLKGYKLIKLETQVKIYERE